MNATREGVLAGSDAEHDIQAKYRTADRAGHFYENSVLNHLNERMTAFIERQEMVFVATADAAGECDATFRAGPPGFVRVVDRRRLAYPEYRGNGVMASLANISRNAHVGLLFVDFLQDSVGLHVNGAVRIVEADDALGLGLERPDPTGPPKRAPERWVLVEVDEAYIPCSKPIPRLLRGDRETGTEQAKRKGGDYFRTARRRETAEAAAGQADHCAVDRERTDDEPEYPPPTVRIIPIPAQREGRRWFRRR